MSIKLTAINSGYFIVSMNGIDQTPKHTVEREAAEHAVKLKEDNPDDEVNYRHEYKVLVENEITVIPSPIPSPSPIPEPIPTQTPSKEPIIITSPGFWSQPIVQDASILSNSDILVADLVRQSKINPLPTMNFKPWTMPFYSVNGNSIIKTPVTLKDAGGNQISIVSLFAKGIPIPIDAKPGFNNTDGKIQILDLDTDTYYEMQRAVLTDGVWTANNGAICLNWSKSNGQMPWYTGSNYNSCTATWLPITPGLIKLSELKTGIPTHALCMAIAEPSNAHVYPAKGSDGMSGKVIPEGTKFRFPSNITIDSSLPLIVQFAIKAIRDYGVYIIDKCPGGSITLYCEDPKDLGDYSFYTKGLFGYQLGSMIPWGMIQAIA